MQPVVLRIARQRGFIELHGLLPRRGCDPGPALTDLIGVPGQPQFVLQLVCKGRFLDAPGNFFQHRQPVPVGQSQQAFTLRLRQPIGGRGGRETRRQ